MLLRLFGPFLCHKVRLTALTLFRFNFLFHFCCYTTELLRPYFSLFYNVHTFFSKSNVCLFEFCFSEIMIIPDVL